MVSIPIMFRPLVAWPGPVTTDRRRSPFGASWPATTDLLGRELFHLGARDVVLQIALEERDIRNDGLPRANARKPYHPGVVLAFNAPGLGPLKYQTDAFDDWQANVRAIALGLEALRKVDRYGITKKGEQYAGWKALGAGGPEPAMTVEAAARFIAAHSGAPHTGVAADPAVYRQAYRGATKRLHPDADGSTEEFQRLQEAKRVLDAHHGGA